MSDKPLLSDLDLAALLCSRVCHDIISPVGAITNGLEVLDDEDDEAMKEIALDLIRRSAKTASAKLRFCRMAFGASGSAGAYLDLTEAEEVARGFIGEEKVKLAWDAPRETRPKAEAKLLLNLLMVALLGIPRGGQVTVRLDGDEFAAIAEGEGAKLPEKPLRLFQGEVPVEEIDPRLVQVYYAMRIAEEIGCSLDMRLEGTTFMVTARPDRSRDRETVADAKLGAEP
ncbi:histidine phosphotransferase ChpT [Rhodoligotrophos defluvii]|uniref:histidine phosphotransferase ChpT n=1 Tax=Rhodoligotrophos defluvii TaxID=2561934 RepID=UPI0010C94347|nr:histidine phosphotransferase family protein [Rhodoligotrophos defluvii]